MPEPRALLDGHSLALHETRLPMTDEGVARGDGAFETVGIWDGHPFGLHEHLARLNTSLRALGLPAADSGLLAAEAQQVLAGWDADGALRVYITASGTRVLTLSPPPDRPAPQRLSPQPAPWVRPLGSYGPAGAKTMSYAPNMAATRAAKAQGADDALLISLEGLVLEGPTFCVLWVANGRLCTPDVALGIVDSISRRSLLQLASEIGLEIEEGRWPLEALAQASEVMLCSAVRDVLAVTAVGSYRFAGPTPVRDQLSPRLMSRRRSR